MTASVKVYVIGGSAGPVKIGSAMSVRARLASLQTGYPYRLRSYGSWPHDRAETVEARAHVLLHKHRLVGEWFNVSPQIAKDAVARAIRIVNGTERLPTEAPPQLRFTIGYRPHADRGDDIHRIGYARLMPDCDMECQIERLLVSGVGSLDIYAEELRGRGALIAALMDYRDGDLLLAWSPRVFGRQKIGLTVRTLYVEPLTVSAAFEMSAREDYSVLRKGSALGLR